MLLAMWAPSTARAQQTGGGVLPIPPVGSGTPSYPLLAPTTPTDCSAPQYSFTGDTNTGVGYGGADALKLCVGGSGVVGVTSSGATFSNLTAGRVGFAGASGLLTDDAGLTYNSTTDILTLLGAVIAPYGTFGASTAPSDGAVRLGNDDYVKARTTGGSSVNLIGLNSADQVAIATSGQNTRFGANLLFGGLADASINYVSANYMRNGTAGSGKWESANVYGGANANDDLVVEGTSNATKTTSNVGIQPSGGTTTLGSTGGDVTVNGPLIGTAQALSGAGAVNITQPTTNYTSTGGAEALTLANGTAGQLKTIVHVVDGGSGVLTPTTALGYTTITFTNAGDAVTLQYTAQGWVIIGWRGVTIA